MDRNGSGDSGGGRESSDCEEPVMLVKDERELGLDETPEEDEEARDIDFDHLPLLVTPTVSGARSQGRERRQGEGLAVWFFSKA